MSGKISTGLSLSRSRFRDRIFLNAAFEPFQDSSDRDTEGNPTPGRASPHRVRLVRAAGRGRAPFSLPRPRNIVLHVRSFRIFEDGEGVFQGVGKAFHGRGNV
jgi:hypothetical protein